MKERTKREQIMWDQFCRLGEMIGDGLHYEDPWINKEYNRLRKILVPESEELKAIRRENIDKLMLEVLQNKKCECGGEIKQKRSGTKVAYCQKCNQRYVAKFKQP